MSLQVRKKIRNYIDFTFSVTHGINIETIASQLPNHLQLELYSNLNRRMVEQVKLFVGCPRDFFQAIVMKLVPCICVAGDYVFCEGEVFCYHVNRLPDCDN